MLSRSCTSGFPDDHSTRSTPHPLNATLVKRPGVCDPCVSTRTNRAIFWLPPPKRDDVFASRHVASPPSWSRTTTTPRDTHGAGERIRRLALATWSRPPRTTRLARALPSETPGPSFARDVDRAMLRPHVIGNAALKRARHSPARWISAPLMFGAQGFGRAGLVQTPSETGERRKSCCDSHHSEGGPRHSPEARSWAGRIAQLVAQLVTQTPQPYPFWCCVPRRFAFGAYPSPPPVCRRATTGDEMKFAVATHPPTRYCPPEAETPAPLAFEVGGSALSRC